MDLESKTILMHSFGELYMIYGTIFIQLSKASLGIWGKTQTITRPTDINLAAESNAIPMHTAYQTLGQSLLEMPHVEDTPAANKVQRAYLTCDVIRNSLRLC